MAYTPPTITSTGLQIPSFNDIITNLIAQYLATYGAAVYVGDDSSDGQWLNIVALIYSDVCGALQQIYLQLNPQYATGTSLDMIGQLIGTPRQPATYSYTYLTVTGTPGAIVYNGIAQDTNGNLWNLPGTVTITGGSVTVFAQCQTIGAITANIGAIGTIYTPSAGWTGVTNANPVATGLNGTAGQPVEPDSAYRARLLISQSLPSLTLLAGTAAAVADVAGVTRSKVYENPTNSTDGTTGAPPHSITVVVEGGAASSIAQAIYNNKGIGCYTNGTSSYVVTDPNNGNISQTINYVVLGYVQIAVGLNVTPLAGFTSATQAAIQQYVIAYLNGLGIGQPVVYSELYGAALQARTNPDQPTFAITAISDGYQAAQTTAVLTSGSFIVVVTSAVGISPGQQVTGPGIPIGSVQVTFVSGTSITLTQAANENITSTLTFFTEVALGSTITIPWNQAALGLPANVDVFL